MPELKSKIVEKIIGNKSRKITFYYFGDEAGEKRASDDELIQLFKKITPSHSLLTSDQTIDVVYLSLSNHTYTESGIRTFDHVKIEDNAISKDGFTFTDGNPDSAPDWVRKIYNKENPHSSAVSSDEVQFGIVRKTQSDSDSYNTSSDDEVDGNSQSRKRTRDNTPRAVGTLNTQIQREKDKTKLRNIKIRINNAIAEAYQKSKRQDIYNSVIQEHASTITHGQDYTLSDVETLLKALLNKFIVTTWESAWESASSFFSTETSKQNEQKKQERQNLMTLLAPLMINDPAILDAEYTILNKNDYVTVEKDVQDLKIKEHLSKMLLPKSNLSAEREVTQSLPINSTSSTNSNNFHRNITGSLRKTTPSIADKPFEYKQSGSAQLSNGKDKAQTQSSASTFRSISLSQPQSSVQALSENEKTQVQSSISKSIPFSKSKSTKRNSIGNVTIDTPLTVTAKQVPEFKNDQNTSELSRSQNELERKKKEITDHESKIQDSISKSGDYVKHELQLYYDKAVKYFKNDATAQNNNKDEEIEELDNKVNNYLNLLRFISNEDSKEAFWLLVTEENGQNFSDLFRTNGKPLLIKNNGKVYLYGLSKKGEEELIDLELSIEEQNSIRFPNDHSRSEVTNNDLPATVRDKILSESVYFNLRDLKYQLVHKLSDRLVDIDLNIPMEEKLDSSFPISKEYTKKITDLSDALATIKQSFENEQKKYQKLKDKLKDKVDKITKEMSIEEELEVDELNNQAVAAKNECIKVCEQFLLKIDEKNELIKKINEEQKTRDLIIIKALDVCVLVSDDKIKKFETSLEKLEEWEHSDHIVMESEYEASNKLKNVSSKLEKNLAASRKLHDFIDNNRTQLKKAAVNESSASITNEQIISVERNAPLEKSQKAFAAVEAFTDFTDIFNNLYNLLNEFNQEKTKVEKFIACHDAANNYFKSSFEYEASSNNGNISETSNEGLFNMDPNENTEDDKVGVEIKNKDEEIDFEKILTKLYVKLFKEIPDADPKHHPNDLASLKTAFDNLENIFKKNNEIKPPVNSDHQELPAKSEPPVNNEHKELPLESKQPVNNEHKELPEVKNKEVVEKPISLQPPKETITDEELKKLIVSLELKKDAANTVPDWAVDTKEKHQSLRKQYNEFISAEKQVAEKKDEIRLLIEAFRKKENSFSDENEFNGEFNKLKTALELKKTELTAKETVYKDSKTKLKSNIWDIQKKYSSDDLSLQTLSDSESQRLAKLYNRLKLFLEELGKKKYTSSLELAAIDDPTSKALALKQLHTSARKKLNKTKYKDHDFKQQVTLETMDREERNTYLKAYYLHVVIQAADSTPEKRRQAYEVANLRPISHVPEKMHTASAGQPPEDNNQNKYSYSLDHNSILDKEKPWYEKTWNKFKDFWYEYGGAISTTATLLGGFALVVIGAAIANPIVMLAGGGVILAGGAETLIGNWITVDKGKKQEPERIKYVESKKEVKQEVKQEEDKRLSTSVIYDVIEVSPDVDPNAHQETPELQQGIQHITTKPIAVIKPSQTQTETGQRFSRSR